MEKNPKILSITSGLLIFFFMILFLSRMAFAEEEADQQFLGFDLAGYSNKGEKTWEVRGKSADILTDTIRLKNVDANLFGEEKVNLTADKGDFDKANNKFHLEDNVVAITETGSKLTTESLDWAQDSNLITTADKIKVEKENMTATSIGAEVKPDLNKAKMLEDVVVEIQTLDKEKGLKKTIITCDGPLEIDYEAQIAVFNNNVKVTDDVGEMYSDKMDVFFDFKTKQIDQIVSSGNVKIIRGENISYSEKAVYTASSKKLLLIGRPKLILYSQEGLGDVSIGD